MNQMKSVLCDYCQLPAPLVDSKVIYGLSYGMAYYCTPCKAWVGCHKGTIKPLGRLANAELREWKKRAHTAFDPLWRHGEWTRKKAYKWLAAQLDIKHIGRDCHIGMFGLDTCRHVVEVCKEYGNKAA